MKYAAFVAALFLTACAGLRPLPAPAAHCGTVAGVDALWTCIGAPDSEHRESSFTTTARVAVGDMTRRILDSIPSRSCNETPWPQFERLDRDVPGAAPLRAFAHRGDANRPVIFLLHGLFDSKSTRYVRITAEALARDGFGVVAADMRWHGCLFDSVLPSTLGLEEQRDVVSWAASLANDSAYQHRDFGLIGFSLGALDVIQIAGSDAGAKAFRAGAIAICPGAPLEALQARLDAHPNPLRIGTDAVFVSYFRWQQRARNARLGLRFWSSRPFGDYLAHVAATHAPPLPDTAHLLALVQPAEAVARATRPLLVIGAEDDPIMTAASLRVLERAAAANANVHVIATRDGGHLGHLGRYRQWIADAFNDFFANAGATR